METNGKILKAGIILIAVLVVLGYLGVYLLTIKEPVFIKHYIEEQIYTGYQQGPRQVDLQLYYITNAGDNRVVSRVDFPEYPEIQVPASEYGMHGGFMTYTSGPQQTPGSVKGRYSMRTVYLGFSFEEDYYEETIEITKAVIHLSDGSVVETEIGSVTFHFDEERSEVLESRGGSGSGALETREFSVKEDIELIEVFSPILPVIQDSLEMKINGRDFKDIEGMNIEAGETFLVEANTQGSRGSQAFGEELRYLKFQPKLRFISEKGTEETRILVSGWYPIPNYEFIEIFQYLRQKGAL